MKVERIQKVTKKAKQKKQDFKDKKQYSRMFLRSYRGGLSRKLIAEYEEANNVKI